MANSFLLKATRFPVHLHFSKNYSMKTLVLVLAAGISIAACNQRSDKSAGEQPVNAMEDSTNFTEVQWMDSLLDLGTVKEGAQVNVSFRFKNVGDKPLVISHVQAGCGCTVPETPKEPYQPGTE